MPRRACASVSLCGSVGLSSLSPRSIAVNVLVSRFAKMSDSMALPLAGRSGVLKYAYSGTVSRSLYSPVGPVSKSYTVIEMSAAPGSCTGVLICGHEYWRRWACATRPGWNTPDSSVMPSHSSRLWTSAP